MTDDKPPRITCYVCRKPVDAITWFDSLATHERVILAKCHGAWDEMRLSGLDMMLHPLPADAQGVAFRLKEIESVA